MEFESNQHDQDEDTKQHFMKFQEFLGRKVDGKSGLMMNPSDKLVKLSDNQFKELEQDVYDELIRREFNIDPFLPLNTLFHPKRNQARQKLATLQLSRFKELLSDVFNDIIKRNSGLNFNFNSLDILANDLQTQAPIAKQIGKSLDNNLPPNHLPPIPINRALISDSDNLKTRLRDKDRYIDQIVQEYEEKARQSEKKYRDLINEHQDLTSEFNSLRQDHVEQSQIAKDIRQEASSLLQEVKLLSIESKGLRGDLSQAHAEINEHRTEVDRLKLGHKLDFDQLKSGHKSEIEKLRQDSRRVSTESRSLKSSKSTEQLNLKTNRTLPNLDFEKDKIEDGIYPLELFQSYQRSIAALLTETRKSGSTAILVAMKSLVIVCKDLTLFEDREARVKDNLTQALTNLMGIAKRAATSISPIYPEIVVGCCILTESVIQMTEMIIPSVSNIPDLKKYLEKQTDMIVQSIEKLLKSLRQPNQPIMNPIHEITSRVEQLLQVSNNTIGGDKVGAEILGFLANSNKGLGIAAHYVDRVNTEGGEADGVDGKQEVASRAYEIAKYIKQLISILE